MYHRDYDYFRSLSLTYAILHNLEGSLLDLADIRSVAVYTQDMLLARGPDRTVRATLRALCAG